MTRFTRSLTTRTRSSTRATRPARRAWLGPLWDGVVSPLKKFVDLVQKFLSEVGKFITQPGVPWTLWNHGNDWTNHVGGPVGGLAGAATVGQTQIDERWQGPAATAYLGTLPDQNKALAAIKAATDELDDALTKVAGGIIAFWVALLAAFIPFVIELLGWLGLAATGAGAPAAAADSGASTAKVIALVTAIVTAAVTYLTAVATQSRPLAHIGQRHHRRWQHEGGQEHQLAPQDLLITP